MLGIIKRLLFEKLLKVQQKLAKAEILVTEIIRYHFFGLFVFDEFFIMLIVYLIFYYLSFLQLFFPIVTNGHWFGFAVNFEYKVFAFLDSLLD